MNETNAKQHQPPPRLLLTKQELADRLRVDPRTISAWQSRGYFPYLKTDRYVFYIWEEVWAHLMRRFRVQDQDPAQGTTQPPGPDTPSHTISSADITAPDNETNTENQEKGNTNDPTST